MDVLLYCLMASGLEYAKHILTLPFLPISRLTPWARSQLSQSLGWKHVFKDISSMSTSDARPTLVRYWLTGLFVTHYNYFMISHIMVLINDNIVLIHLFTFCCNLWVWPSRGQEMWLSLVIAVSPTPGTESNIVYTKNVW